MFVSKYPLAGTDDYIVRVAIDRSTPRTGGLWIELRESDIPGLFTTWDEHAELRHFPGTRDKMRDAARKGI